MYIRRVIGTWPSDIPTSWMIFNAPRPLWGTKTWEGYFLHGIFYAAIDPADEFRERMIRDNVDNDGWVTIWLPRSYVLGWFVGYAEDNGVDIKDPFITEDIIKDCFYQYHAVDKIDIEDFLKNIENHKVEEEEEGSNVIPEK